VNPLNDSALPAAIAERVKGEFADSFRLLEGSRGPVRRLRSIIYDGGKIVDDRGTSVGATATSSGEKLLKEVASSALSLLLIDGRRICSVGIEG